MHFLNQFPVFYAHNVPYTFIDKMGPHTDFNNMDYKIVYYNMMEDKPYNRVSITRLTYHIKLQKTNNFEENLAFKCLNIKFITSG